MARKDERQEETIPPKRDDSQEETIPSKISLPQENTIVSVRVNDGFIIACASGIRELVAGRVIGVMTGRSKPRWEKMVFELRQRTRDKNRRVQLNVAWAVACEAFKFLEFDSQKSQNDMQIDSLICGITDGHCQLWHAKINGRERELFLMSTENYLAFGFGSVCAREVLEQGYNVDMNTEDAKNMAVLALRTASISNEFDGRVEVYHVTDATVTELNPAPAGE